MSTHAAKSICTEVLAAKVLRPRIKAILPKGRTRLPPRRSIALPTRGPKKAATKSAAVKAQKKVSVAIPRDSDIGTAKIAGR